MAGNNGGKPITQQGNLAKLPRALAPLTERPQWAVWRWTQKPDGTWQKPPYMATQAERHASTKDPTTWSDYSTALATVQAGHADGISYVLTAEDPFAAIDLDHCRELSTHSIDIWAQHFLQRGRLSYSEVTPSGSGLRIWGLADGQPLHRKFTLKAGDREFEPDKDIAAELFRRTNKALTITGATLDPAIKQLTNIDKVFDWAIVWGERRKAAAAEAAAKAAPTNGKGFNGGDGCGYSVDQIEQFVREGAPETENRSELFHTIVGHYLGCGWTAEQIYDHLQQFPDGISAKYHAEGRLSREIVRSAEKFGAASLPAFDTNGWMDSWQAKTPQPEPVPEPAQTVLEEEQPELEPAELKEEQSPSEPLEPELEEEPPEQEQEPLELDAELEEELDPELEEEEEDDDELEDDEPAEELPPLYAHGNSGARPTTAWLVKHVIPAQAKGLLSGQWGSAKTFVVIDLAAAVATGQPFLGHAIKRQSGVLFIAAEGANQVRLRFDAVWKEKCGGGEERAPFCWYETAPVLLQKDAVKKLIAMARQAEAMLMKDFGLPLGLIIIDTLVACAGYRRSGEENDNAVGQALMNVLEAVAREISCYVLGVDHLGKNIEAGTRGAIAKESSADSVLTCLGHRDVSGTVTNTRLAVRKNRGGAQGQQYPFTLRPVDMGLDEDGEPETTMVVDWLPGGAAGAAPTPSAPEDPWAKPKRQDQRTAVLRLKRVLMAILAEQGVDLPIALNGPVVRMVDEKLVRKAFYACTPTEGDAPKQKAEFRRKRFGRALDWAEDEELIGASEIDGIAYLWLRPKSQSEGSED